MTLPDLYLKGQRICVAKQIGKGGEGEVFLLAGNEKKAIKYYTGGHDQGREAKVRAMVALGLASHHPRVAFPEDVVTLKSGSFAGFTMRLIEGCRQVHELYGVKSRKAHYPKADYRFLVRSAANLARAITEVHQSNCVIGDLNHSGILVSDSAVVALIDADSFQLESGGRTYPCLVGVPDFTPPELQGKSLAGVTRTRFHDNFGLAVAIFQILCMGRHPYAGRYGDGSLTLEQLIGRNLFAYSRTRNNGSSPPLGVVTLDDFPRDISTAFELAFGIDPYQRPDPSRWADLLHGLETKLSRCAADSMHYYPSAAKSCPWCRMEKVSGAALFISMASPTLVPSIHGFDIDKVLAAVRSFTLPDPLTIRPKLPPLPQTPSFDAVKAKKGDPNNKAVALAIAAGAVVPLLVTPRLFFLTFIGLLIAYFKYKGTSKNPLSFRL